MLHCFTRYILFYLFFLFFPFLSFATDDGSYALSQIAQEETFSNHNQISSHSNETDSFFISKANPLDGIPLVAAKQKPVITVGYEKGFGVISNPTSYSSKGLGYELLTKLGYFADVEFEFVEIEGSLFDAVKDGTVDIAGFYSKTPGRADGVAFSNISVDLLQHSLTTKGDKGFYYDDPQSINGKTVASYYDNPGEKILEAYLKKHNISVNLIHDDVRNYDQLDADLYLMVSDKKTSEEFYTVLNLALDNLYFFASDKNKALIEYIDTILYDFILSNYAAYSALLDKYKAVGNEFQNRALTRKEANLFKGKTFRVGYVDNHAPYQSSDLTGNPKGISVEFMNKLAEKYGFEIEYIPYNLENTWTSFEDLDILLGLVGERNHITRFYKGTDPYSSVNMNVVFQENFAQKYKPEELELGLPKGAKVGVINYINFRYSEFFQDFKHSKIVHFTNSDHLMEAFLEGEIDAVIATDLGTNSIASSITVGKAQSSTNLPLNMNFQISRRISDTYLELFNIIINKEPKEVIAEITAREVAKYMPTFGTEQFLKNNFYFILAGAILLTFMVIALIVLIRQRSTISILAKDDITPLSSMTQFTADVDKILESAELNQYEMIILDIDYFRMVNNYYGTDKGTEVIQNMAKALLDAYSGIEVLMARRIAEQFLVFKKIDDGPALSEVINSYVIPRVKVIVGENYSLKMSMAYCKNAEKNDTMTDLLDNVNIAHQQAKKQHKISYVEFTDEMRKDASTMLDVIYRMEHAIGNKEFKVHYQPKIDLNSLKIIGAEALIRWIPPIGKPIYPNEFIPIMEKNGFITQLELYVFEEVCIFLNKNKEIVEIPKVAVNISPITLSNTAMLKKLVEFLKKYKINPSQIEIEITESAIGDFEETLPVIIKILHKIGFSVAMDDFGAGNSSLNRLSVIEVDVLKLDKVFLDFHEDAPRGSLVVQQIIMLGKQLGMKIVAEGIEQKNQAIWLQEIKCDIAQGFYFAKVLKEDDFIGLLLENKQYTL